MRQMNCRFDDLAFVVRNTTGCPCTEHEMGRSLTCKNLALMEFGAVWMLPKPIECKTCGADVFGFLDADLQPIRPPGKDTGSRVPQERPEITAATIDVPEPVTGIWALNGHMLEIAA